MGARKNGAREGGARGRHARGDCRWLPESRTCFTQGLAHKGSQRKVWKKFQLKYGFAVQMLNEI